MQPKQNYAPPQNGPYVQHRAQQQVPPAPRNGMNAATTHHHNNNHTMQAPPQNVTAARPAQQGYPSPKPNADPRQVPPKRVDPPVGFYPAGMAAMIQETNLTAPINAPTFNPHAESPSIRKTSGIDHSRSGPVNKEVLGAINQGVGPATTTAAVAGQAHQVQHGQVQQAQRPLPNVTNPHLDANRKVGMPNSPSPFQNRAPYKPPGPAAAAAHGKRSYDGGVAIPAQ